MTNGDKQRAPKMIWLRCLRTMPTISAMRPTTARARKTMNGRRRIFIRWMDGPVRTKGVRTGACVRNELAAWAARVGVAVVGAAVPDEA